MSSILSRSPPLRIGTIHCEIAIFSHSEGQLETLFFIYLDRYFLISYTPFFILNLFYIFLFPTALRFNTNLRKNRLIYVVPLLEYKGVFFSKDFTPTKQKSHTISTSRIDRISPQKKNCHPCRVHLVNGVSWFP